MGCKVSYYDKAKNLVKFLVKEDLSIVSDDEYQKRFKICNACEFYKAKGNFGLGECKVCGCTKLKLKFKRGKCPKGKWKYE